MSNFPLNNCTRNLPNHLDNETCQLLQHLMQDIQTVLQSSSPKSYASLGQRLRDAIQALEESHPSLVLTIGRVLDHLAQV